jgi:S1-C subfamily serine protease
MRPLKSYRFIFMILMLALAALACNGGQGPVEPVSQNQNQGSNDSNSSNNTGDSNDGLSSGERSNLIAATVRIFGLFEENGDLVPGYVGSGTLLSPNGMILTNAHVASPASQGDTESEPDALAVAIIESEDRPPVFSYLAEVKAVDGFLDLAVIQIVSTIDGDSIDPESLNLPYVEVGDSDAVHVGDHVSIFGFPAIGGDTITFTSGNVSGFTSEDQIGDRAWIKTDATISGGNSGGLAANDSAQIVGVPTIASSGADTEITDCRVVQDTNGDGQLTNDDTCIPIGGFINGIRPVKLALPLIKAARSGQAYVSPYGSAAPTTGSTGSESVNNFEWYSVDNDGNFKDPVSSYESGVSIIGVAFNFSGFENGQGWSDVWYVDGEKVYEGSYVWDAGESGTFYDYINTTDGSALPTGNYTVEIYVDNGGNALGSAEVSVGSGGGSTAPSKPKNDGVTIFGNVYDSDTNKPIADVYVFVLNPSVTYDEWAANNYADGDIYSSTQTDSNGDYTIPDPVQRGESYTVAASIAEYYDQYGDDLTWTEDDPDRYQLDIGMSK